MPAVSDWSTTTYIFEAVVPPSIITKAPFKITALFCAIENKDEKTVVTQNSNLKEYFIFRLFIKNIFLSIVFKFHTLNILPKIFLFSNSNFLSYNCLFIIQFQIIKFYSNNFIPHLFFYYFSFCCFPIA